MAITLTSERASHSQRQEITRPLFATLHELKLRACAKWHHDANKNPNGHQESDLYSSLWASCDALRGGMDASQYKDYVLFLLFIKYISDKYGNSDDFAPPVTIP